MIFLMIFFDKFKKRKNFSTLRAVDQKVDGDFLSFKIEKDQLAGELLSGSVDNFRIMSSSSFVSPDVVSVGLLPTRFSLINCFDVVFPVLSEDENLMKSFQSRIDDLVRLVKPNCAFLCEMKTAANAVLYPSFPDNVVALKNERPSLVADYLRSGGVFLEKLRMAYAVNYIKESHLRLIVNGKSLEDLVSSGGEWGTIFKVDEGIFKWIISVEDVQKINETMGSSGLLCSWVENMSGLRTPKLP